MTFIDTICPSCKTKHDAVTHAGLAERRPKVGNIDICGTCSFVSIYAEGPSGLVREPFDVSQLSPQQRAEIKSLQDFVLAYRHSKN